MEALFLDRRNERLFKSLDLALEEESRLGVVYGAAHLKGIDEHVTAKGFTPIRTLWMPVLEVDLSVLEKHVGEYKGYCKTG